MHGLVPRPYMFETRVYTIEAFELGELTAALWEAITCALYQGPPGSSAGHHI